MTYYEIAKIILATLRLVLDIITTVRATFLVKTEK